MDPQATPDGLSVESGKFFMYRGYMEGEADWVGRHVEVHSGEIPLNNLNDECCDDEPDCTKITEGLDDGGTCGGQSIPAHLQVNLST